MRHGSLRHSVPLLLALLMCCGKCSGDVLCPANTRLVLNPDINGSNTLDDCVCLPGYQTNRKGVACSACPMNHFSTGGEMAYCTRCALDAWNQYGYKEFDIKCDNGKHSAPWTDMAKCQRNQYGGVTTAGGSTGCFPCPAHSGAETFGGIRPYTTGCICDAGYTGVGGGPCVLCPTGTLKPKWGQDSCIACPANALPCTGADWSCKQNYDKVQIVWVVWVGWELRLRLWEGNKP